MVNGRHESPKKNEVSTSTISNFSEEALGTEFHG